MAKDTLRIWIEDITAAGHCARGAKTWFTLHGLDFKRFLREGATEEELLATGDVLATQVIERKKARGG